MFVRFRQTVRRLQASLIATRRRDGRVLHEHIASLGSLPRSPSPSDRLAFWTKLHQRLNALSNRVDEQQRGAILTAIQARIPMPTLDEQQAMQLGRAQGFWTSLAEGLSPSRTAVEQLQAKMASREDL